MSGERRSAGDLRPEGSDGLAGASGLAGPSTARSQKRERFAQDDGGGASRGWSWWARVGFRFVFCFFTLFALACANVTVWEAVPYAGGRLEAWASSPVYHASAWVAVHWLHKTGAAATIHASGFGDKALDWISAGLMLVVAIAAAAVWTAVDRRRREYRTLAVWMRYGLRLAIVASMFVYGAMKVAPVQIAAPSLAVLNEPVGSMSRMTLLWTVLGLSPLYERLCGWLEMTAAVLLLFRRTALAGALVGVVIMANVVLFDTFFDIPVKLYGVTLLLMLFVVIAPDANALLRFFVRGKMATPISAWTPRFARPWMRWTALSIEALIVITLGVNRPLARERQWRTESSMMQQPSPWAGIWHVDAAASTLQMQSFGGAALTDVVFEPNGHLTLRAADGTLWMGTSYRRGDASVMLYMPPRSQVPGRVQGFDGEHMRLETAAGALVMTRVKTPKGYRLYDLPYHWTNEYGEEM